MYDECRVLTWWKMMMMIYEFDGSLSLSLPTLPNLGRWRTTTKDLGFERYQTWRRVADRERAFFLLSFLFFGCEEGWLCGVMRRIL